MATAGVKPQTRLGRYELLARLAAGGMGEIFLARLEGAEGFEKLYVVKRILPHLADDARFREMLISEARIASRLSHPNICQVYELGDEGGQLYIVMEYLDGVSLLPLLRRQSKANQLLELGLVAGIIQQTCDALHYAHDLRDRSGEYVGLVHRDVTPANIFLTESGVAKLLDFGIAKAKGASANTQTGTVKGKYAYMAPEQLRGGEIDRRVDVFALGVVLYETLALRRLFQRPTDYLTFRAVMEQPIPDVRRYRGDTPDALAGAIARALDRAPANRFDSARHFGAAVLDAVGGVGIRPWTQGEISDFVRTKFATALGVRAQQVSQAIGRDATTMIASSPLIITPDEDTRDDGDDDGFPSVDTEIAEPPPSPPGTPASEFVGWTPSPFATPGESTSSGHMLQPLQPLQSPQAGSPGQTGHGPQGSQGSMVAMAYPAVQEPPSQTKLVERRRVNVWPAVAVSMVFVAGGALYLVYEQSRQQKPTQVVINSAPVAADAGTAAPQPARNDAGQLLAHVPIDAAVAVVVSNGPHDAQVAAPPAGGSDGRSAYDHVLDGIRKDINQCKLANTEDPLPQTATIKITTDGRTDSVQLQPQSAQSSRLGSCLVAIMSGLRWPVAADEKTLTVPFTPKPM